MAIARNGSALHVLLLLLPGAGLSELSLDSSRTPTRSQWPPQLAEEGLFRQTVLRTPCCCWRKGIWKGKKKGEERLRVGGRGNGGGGCCKGGGNDDLFSPINSTSPLNSSSTNNQTSNTHTSTHTSHVSYLVCGHVHERSWNCACQNWHQTTVERLTLKSAQPPTDTTAHKLKTYNRAKRERKGR
jgi:hypothetical protein